MTSNGVHWVRAALQVNPYAHESRKAPESVFANEEESPRAGLVHGVRGSHCGTQQKPENKTAKPPDYLNAVHQYCRLQELPTGYQRSVHFASGWQYDDPDPMPELRREWQSRRDDQDRERWAAEIAGPNASAAHNPASRPRRQRAASAPR
ncbi:Coenzyme PQQ synthesis protein F [Rhodococcus sp. AW25M09]|uniref:hypothetical protein n=1 Tax=Rhodococcus sp. AW25M09 TaxID=1268303 RepID=UPI0002AC79FD|nr:hypothetical protein [Rhodococcus sp. AW25M09]CCQ16880.1 Coenzyme PQQ synthesis protein F [Rhodococcus sp. AW25M09]